VLRNLSGEERLEFESLVGEGSFGTWLSLSDARDLGSLHEGLLSLGKAFKGQGKEETAQAYFSLLMQARPGMKVSKEVQLEAKLELDAVVGQGDGWRRAGYLAGRLMDQATDWKMIVPMMAGTLVYQGVKTAMLGRWATQLRRAEFFQRTVPWYIRGGRAELSASVAGFMPEVGTFAGLGRGIRALAGENVEEIGWGQELLLSGITLGVLKIFGSMGRDLVTGRFAGSKLASIAVPQGMIFGGLLTAHKIEAWVGLREELDGATTVVDTLGEVVSLGLGAHLGYQLFPHLKAWQGRLAVKARESLQEIRERFTPLNPWGPALEHAGVPSAGNHWMMGMEGDSEAPSRAVPPTSVEVGATQTAPSSAESPAAARSHRHPRSLRNPEGSIHDGPNQVARKHRSLERGIEAAVRLAPRSCRCLYIEVMGTSSQISQGWWSNSLFNRSTLREVRLRFSDGRLLRVTPGRDLGSGPQIEECPPSLARSPVALGTDMPRSQLVRTTILAPWENAQPASLLGDLLEYLREETPSSREAALPVELTLDADEALVYRQGGEAFRIAKERYRIPRRRGDTITVAVGQITFTFCQPAGQNGTVAILKPDGTSLTLHQRNDGGYESEIPTMTREEVVARLRADPTLPQELAYYEDVSELTVETLEAWESPASRVSIPLPILRRLAFMYGRDVRELIAAVNGNNRSSWLSREDWATPDYPLYIENKYDERMAVASRRGRTVDLLGYLLWRLRKNPRNYFTPRALADAAHVSEQEIRQWEMSHCLPGMDALGTLSRVLQVPMGWLMEARQRTAVHIYTRSVGRDLSTLNHPEVPLAPNGANDDFVHGRSYDPLPEPQRSGATDSVSGDLEGARGAPRSAAEIWGKYMADRLRGTERPSRRSGYLPHHTRGLLRSVEAVTRAAGPHRRCVLIDVVGSEVPGIAGQLGALLERSSQLEEIRLRFIGDGVTWAYRSQGGVMLQEGTPEIKCSVGPAVWVERTDLSYYDPMYTDRPRDQVLRVRLITPWRSPEAMTPFPQLIRQLREARGLSIEEVVEQIWEDPQMARELTDYRYHSFEPTNLENLERGRKWERLQYPVLKRLAEVLHVDVRQLIASHNRTRFPEVREEYWTTADYPVFIEGAADLRRIQAYERSRKDGRKHHSIGSFGWKVWAGRKDPFDYKNVAQFSRESQLHESYVIGGEKNLKAFGPESYRGVVAVLSNIPEMELLRAHVTTHFPDLHPDRVFGGHFVYIDPYRDDAAKIRLYAEDGLGIGKYLYAYRATQPNNPTVEPFAKDCGVDPRSWDTRELNQTPITERNLSDWIVLFDKTGMPLELLKAVAEEDYGIPRDGGAWLLAESKRGTSLRAIHRSGGTTDHRTLLSIGKNEGRRTQRATLLKVKAALPGLDSARIYREQHPEIEEVFPELGRDPSSIVLSNSQIEEALYRFHSGERIFAALMNPPAVDLPKQRGGGTWMDTDFAAYSGFSRRLVYQLQRGFVNVQSDQELLRLARGLQVDPKLLYLHFRPEILRHYGIVDPNSTEVRVISTGEYDAIMEEANRNFDRDNLRGELKRVITASGETGPVEFVAELFHVKSKSAVSILRGVDLSNDHIRLLDQALEGFSYRCWYEHFNRPWLAFFLGRDSNGAFDYRLPDGINRRELSGLDMQNLLRKKPYHSSVDTERGKKSITTAISRLGGSMTDVDVMRFSRAKQDVDRRLLFLWARREELKPMIEAANP
jgi:transcriptional regulator with XRE-family HTH domain